MQIQDWLSTQIGQDIWNKKYKYENESFDEWLNRVSGENENIRQLILEKKFLFGGRILASRGLQNKGRKVTFSNCYVITPPDDNIESIFDCAKKLARTYSYGGGCGIDISKLSPKGAKINNAAKETTGAVSFMELYDLTTKLIGQQGRRGALMISLDCNHPDLEEFIQIKSNLNKITKANISVRINNDFMRAVDKNQDWELFFERKETGERISKKVKAKDIFHLMAKINWDYAEPGELNWEHISNWNLLSEDRNFEYGGVNPCAEEPLPPGGSCLLGSINLSEFINNPFTSNASFNFNEFIETVKQGVIALNEVLHEGLNLHPLDEQKESVNNWRQIGLGCFGWHDALIKLSIRYGSEESLNLANKIGYEMINTAIQTSSYLTEKYGTYPKYNEEAIFNSKFFVVNTTETTKLLVKQKGLANSQLLTIPPTGSGGTMLGVSTALEPIFKISYMRKTESLHGKDEYYKIYTPIVEQCMKIHDIQNEENLPEFINTAMTIGYKERIEMQSVWQKYIDASISSTINVNNNFTVEEVEDLYLYAWKCGLKGVTIYREGCKRDAILFSESSKNDDITYEEIPRGFIEDVPDGLVYRKYKLKTGCGTLYFFVGIDETECKIYDCFTNTDGVGGCTVNTQANSRLLSAALRGGIPVEYLIEQLNKAGVCPSFQYKRGKGEKLCKGKSCSSAISNILKEILKEFEEDGEENKKATKCLCPECGEELIFEAGCNSCKNCGFSKCN